MPLLLLQEAPIPFEDPIALPPKPEDQLGGRPDTQVGKIGPSWAEWANRMSQTLNAATVVLNTTGADTQAASIGATDFSGGPLSEGLYKLEYYVSVTRAATTSSSLTVTFAWTQNGQAKSVSSGAMTGNTTGTAQSGAFLALVDASTPVTYATTYASVGGTTMQYTIRVTLTKVATG